METGAVSLRFLLLSLAEIRQLERTTGKSHRTCVAPRFARLNSLFRRHQVKRGLLSEPCFGNRQRLVCALSGRLVVRRSQAGIEPRTLSAIDKTRAGITIVAESWLESRTAPNSLPRSSRISRARAP